jgi:hypothetical protein
LRIATKNMQRKNLKKTNKKSQIINIGRSKLFLPLKKSFKDQIYIIA